VLGSGRQMMTVQYAASGERNLARILRPHVCIVCGDERQAREWDDRPSYD